LEYRADFLGRQDFMISYMDMLLCSLLSIHHPSVCSTQPKQNGAAPGAGGVGGYGRSIAGGNGAPGIVII
jgi:hypothetical protein